MTNNYGFVSFIRLRIINNYIVFSRFKIVSRPQLPPLALPIWPNNSLPDWIPTHTQLCYCHLLWKRADRLICHVLYSLFRLHEEYLPALAWIPRKRDPRKSCSISCEETSVHLKTFCTLIFRLSLEAICPICNNLRYAWASHMIAPLREKKAPQSGLVHSYLCLDFSLPSAVVHRQKPERFTLLPHFLQTGYFFLNSFVLIEVWV